MDKQSSGLFKIGKNFQKYICKPPPYTHVENLEVTEDFEFINGFYNICDRRNKFRTVLKLLNSDSNIRNILIDLKLNLTYNFENVSDKMEVLKLVHSKNDVETLKELDKYHAELVPFFHYLEELVFRRQIVTGEIDEHLISSSLVIPTDLVATCLKYSKSGDLRLLHELTKCYFLYLNDSPSVRLGEYFDEDEEARSLCGLHPKLSLYLGKLLLRKDGEGISSTKLGNFRELMNQHRTLNVNLWKNVRALHSSQYDFIQTEITYIKKDVESFTKQLASSFNLDIISSTLSELTDKCVLEINKFQDSVASPEHRDAIIRFAETLQRSSENLILLLQPSMNNINERIELISTVHTQLAFMKMTLNSQLHLIDPLTKKVIKKEHLEQAIRDFEGLKMSFELQNEVFSASPDTMHELHRPIKDIIQKLSMKAKSLGEYVAVRSDKIQYESVFLVIKSAIESFLSKDSFEKVESMSSVIKELITANNQRFNVSFTETQKILHRHEISLKIYENTIIDWSKYRISYPDIMEPLLSSLAQFLYGYKLKVSLLRNVLEQFEYLQQNIDIRTTITRLVKYPVLDGAQTNFSECIDSYWNANFQMFIEKNIRNEPYIADVQNLSLLKCGIQEAFNACVEYSDLHFDDSIYEKCIKLIKIFVDKYNEQEHKKEEEKKEAESLYKMKTKCKDLTEEEEIEEELKDLFTNHHSIDFADMQPNAQLTDTDDTVMPEAKSLSTEISYDDLKFVSDLHTILVKNFTRSEWLNPSENKNVSSDFVKPLVQKFKVFRHLLDKVVASLDYEVDKELFGSFSVLLGVIQKYGKEDTLEDEENSSNQKDYSDFYKDTDVDEVKSCYHILEDLRLRIEELLDEWPEQPTLKSIVDVINRIYNFDITNPVSRFLTGFEILLNKCHEWEQVAHSGVSLSNFEQNIIQQIITWRKKELAMWKNLLNSTFDKMNDSKAKWWLYLFGITEQFITEKLFSAEELITTLKKFIMNSNLAEFEMRLDLLYTFHCFAVQFKAAGNHRETQIYQNILWNLYQYYDQFRVCINLKVKDLRAPVEKKLKEYVKIVKWKDVSYWSVKETVDKTHKILHKHVREFKEIMSQPVFKFLIHTNTNGCQDQNAGIWDKPQKKTPKKYDYTKDAGSYMADKCVTLSTETNLLASIEEEHRIIPKINSYFKKSRILCKDIVQATRYPDLVKDIDEFVAEIIENSNRLQKLEVDTTSPKNKQKSQAKNILQQKHRALADLFKKLSKIGLSFRTGIVNNSVKNATEEFTMKPLDLIATLEYIEHLKNDDKILTLWDSCELYYLRSLIRFDTLESAMLQPAKDLGVSNIDRCRGYTAHILSLSRKQKVEVIEMSRNLYYLRYCFNTLFRFSNSKKFIESNYLNSLHCIMKKLRIVSKQYKVILNTFPVEHTLNISEVKIMELEGQTNFPKYKYDSHWNELYSSFNDIIKHSNKIETIIKKSKSEVPCVDFDLKQADFIPIDEGDIIVSHLGHIIDRCNDILSLIGNTHLENSLKWLFEQIVNAKNHIEFKILSESVETHNLTELIEDIEESTSKILLVIQEIFKKYSKKDTDKEKEDNKEDGSEDEQFKTLLIENLLNDVGQLNSKKVLKSVKKVTECLISGKLSLSEESKLLTKQYLSVLEQIILLYQYFLTQQVSSYRVSCKLNSVLLNIFIELATKGFCVPPEFSDEMEEQGPGKPSDGMGLGDGKGEKDVSDKIESEDQLDEAQVEGQEKEKDEDPDCEEEDKGIEMSEDFDSKLQDVDKKEDDDDQSDNDSDAEEQMGETEKGANKLDEEVWGSDEEAGEENEDEGEKEEESGNKGANETDQQMVANDNESKNQPEDEDDKGETGEGEENSKKDINEFQEPEVSEEQVDPYHGDNLPEPPEPEAMDLPDDLQLDEGEADKEENTEENPFDIDTMKEQATPPEEQEETPEEKEERKDGVTEFESDDEEIERGDKNDDDKNGDEAQEEENENNENENKDADNQNVEIEENKDETEDQNLDDYRAQDQRHTNEDQVQAMDVDNAEVADKTQGVDSDTKCDQPIDELQQEDKPDQDGAGTSQMEDSQTGHSAQTDQTQEANTNKRENPDLKRKERPGESDIQRSLGDVDEPVQKKLKTIDTRDNEEGDTSPEPEEDEKAKAEMYKHIKDAKESATQVLDAATKEQAEAQKEQAVPDEEETEQPTESSQDLPEEEDADVDVTESNKKKPEKIESKKEKKDAKSHPEGDVLDELEKIEVEGEFGVTYTVSRPPVSSHHTLFMEDTMEMETTLSIEQMNSLRMEVETQLSSWFEPPSDVDAEQAWQKISSVTSPLAQELSEQLRLVLEPSQASRLKGDYRTGRRINMRKVIPYIASQFRKDKIWLRRTKPSKREYQIVLAIDDSSSMGETKSKEMAFESVALISKALTLLESGQLSILSFGDETEILHKLTDQFTEKSGVKLLQKFKFDQTNTNFPNLLDFATEVLSNSQIQTNSLTAKLLIIISDGRGVFSRGENEIKQAVRRGKLANIFTVFVIIDNPHNEMSILENRRVQFKDGKVKIDNYMDVFPFSFYILLRDLITLPNVLSDALRQWFEMVSNLDKQ